MAKENELFYDSLILESIRNIQEIHIYRTVNTPNRPFTWSNPYLPSEIIANTSENMGKVLPASVDNSNAKLENHIDGKHDQVSIKYLKEKNIKWGQTKILPR